MSSRPWQTVPLGTPSGVSELVGLNNPDDNVNIRFPVSDLSSLFSSNPSNNLYWAPDTFTQNGTAIDGSAVITGLGSTSRMYAGMSLENGVFPPSLTIVSVDSGTQITVSGISSYSGSVTLTFSTEREGSDATGNGQITAPFATYEVARQRAIALGAGPGKPFNLIFLGGESIDLGSFQISPWVNASFNNAYVSFDEIIVDSLWEDGGGDGVCVISNMSPESNIEMDFSAQPSFRKSIIFNNVGITNNAFDWGFIGTGKELFYWTNLINTLDDYNYLKSLSFQNFSVVIDSSIGIIGTDSGITSQNSSLSNGTEFDLNSNSFGPLTIRSIGGAANLLRTAGNYIDGAITIDGANCFWEPGIGSYKKPTLLNGGLVAWDIMQEGLWPQFSAAITGPFGPGPGGTAVISGASTLDTYSGFTTNVGWTIPVGQSGQYEVKYMAKTSATINGNYSIDLFLYSDNTSGPIDNTSVEEQQDFITIGGTLIKTLSGFALFQLSAGDTISLRAKNNGDMDVDITEATWSLRRVY